MRNYDLMDDPGVFFASKGEERLISRAVDGGGGGDDDSHFATRSNVPTITVRQEGRKKSERGQANQSYASRRSFFHLTDCYA